MSVSITVNLSFLRVGFFGNSTHTHLVEKGCFFFVCIAWELAVHDTVGEVTDDAMGVAVDDWVSIFIISLIATVFLVVYFWFRQCGVFTLFLMLRFCFVDFCHQFVYFGSRVLVFLGAVHWLARLFVIFCCCATNESLSYIIELEVSSSRTDPVVQCLMLAASLGNKSLKLLLFLALVSFSLQVSHDRLNNSLYSTGYILRKLYYLQ